MTRIKLALKAPEIQAILSGKKSQLRSVITQEQARKILNGCNHASPFGSVGTTILVQEATLADHTTDDRVILSQYEADNEPVLYTDCADPAFDGSVAHWQFSKDRRPAVKMPAWATRLTLEVRSVTAHRLQDISREGACEEGFWPSPGNGLESWNHKLYGNAEKAFAACWDTYHHKDNPFASNPWVCAISFQAFRETWTVENGVRIQGRSEIVPRKAMSKSGTPRY